MSRIPNELELPADTIGSYTRMLAEMRPDNLDVIDMNNQSIDDIRDSHLAAEDRGEIQRMNYGRLSLEQIYEGHMTAERR